MRIEVVVSEFVPPGMAYVIDRSAFGFDEGKLIAFHPDQTGTAKRLEELLDEAALRMVAQLKNLDRTEGRNHAV